MKWLRILRQVDSWRDLAWLNTSPSMRTANRYCLSSDVMRELLVAMMKSEYEEYPSSHSFFILLFSMLPMALRPLGFCKQLKVPATYLAETLPLDCHILQSYRFIWYQIMCEVPLSVIPTWTYIFKPSRLLPVGYAPTSPFLTVVDA